MRNKCFELFSQEHTATATGMGFLDMLTMMNREHTSTIRTVPQAALTVRNEWTIFN